jgi:hypothetical protein
MFNANRILKTKYYTDLTAVKPAGSEVYKNYVPNQLETDNYYLISNVQNIEAGGVNAHKSKVFITIGIYTKTPRENNGVTMDDMADALFSLYPTPQSYPIIEGYQVASVIKESDNEYPVNMDSGVVFINRQIIFSHILNKLN